MLYSHPHKPLHQHLAGVWELTKGFIKDFNFPLISPVLFHEMTAILAVFHDTGKATKYFQGYICSPNPKKSAFAGSKQKSHSLLSAILAYYFAKKIYNNQDKKESWFPLLIYIAIKRHHGNLTEFTNELLIEDGEDEEKLMKEQIEAIDYDELNSELARLRSEIPIRIQAFVSVNKEDLYNSWQEVITDAQAYKRLLRKRYSAENTGFSQYLLFILLYSILLDADKNEAGISIREGLYDRFSLPSNLIVKYKALQSWPVSTKMNALREFAFAEVESFIIDLNKKVYSLCLPTGMGKTLSAFDFAMRLRKKIKDERGYEPRVIYSLPFTSIIDQNEKVIQEILSANGLGLETNILLKHHHLAEAVYVTGKGVKVKDGVADDNRLLEDDEANLLIEGWQSEIIVTTFVQLFHTLLSHKNSQLRKFNKIAQSIVLVDEVQAIPAKYWLLVHEILLELSKQLNTYIILLTATEPKLFSPSEVTQLCDSPKYFAQMNRIKMLPLIKENIKIQELVEKVEIEEGKTYLFICNTIQSSILLVRGLGEKYPEKQIGYLSTNIPPVERLKRIDEIKNGKYQITVSTQIVEAGVDIDFDVVYRDMAPLDSLNQSAGRCNRNGNRTGEFHIVSLTSGSRTYASFIYDSIRLNVTRDIIGDRVLIPESDFYGLINEYYDKVKSRLVNGEARKIIRGVENFYFDGNAGDYSEMLPVSSFQLIEEDCQKGNMFIELNEHAQSVWQEYDNILKIENGIERKQRFSKIKRDFYQYVISVPLKIENCPPVLNGFFYVSNNTLKDYYDRLVGFNNVSSLRIW